MEIFKVIFPISEVETYIFIPPLVAFVISFFTSMGGVSGAFLLLPFQMSVLNYTSPSVSATNLVFNIIAIPSGVYQYIKEKRMAWPLTWVIVAGTLPGVFIGYVIRVVYLPDPATFKLFVGTILMYISFKLLQDIAKIILKKTSRAASIEDKFKRVSKERDNRLAPGLSSAAVIKTVSLSLSRTEYEFWGDRFSFSTVGMFFLALIVGVIGGIYGIGGGAIIAPFCVAIFNLPVYTIAGATLMGTFLTSIAGVIFYSLVPLSTELTKSPDWLLGLLFGAGGVAGMYFGARCQKYFPQTFIKLLLCIFIVFVAFTYIVQYVK